MLNLRSSVLAYSSELGPKVVSSTRQSSDRTNPPIHRGNPLRDECRRDPRPCLRISFVLAREEAASAVEDPGPVSCVSADSGHLLSKVIHPVRESQIRSMDSQ